MSNLEALACSQQATHLATASAPYYSIPAKPCELPRTQPHRHSRLFWGATLYLTVALGMVALGGQWGKYPGVSTLVTTTTASTYAPTARKTRHVPPTTFPLGHTLKRASAQLAHPLGTTETPSLPQRDASRAYPQVLKPSPGSVGMAWNAEDSFKPSWIPSSTILGGLTFGGFAVMSGILAKWSSKPNQQVLGSDALAMVTIVSKEMAAQWNELTDEEKEPLNKIATKDKESGDVDDVSKNQGSTGGSISEWTAGMAKCRDGLVAVAAGAVLAGSVACPLPVDAFTENQQLFLEAWRAVDKAYVDKKFNGTSWFRYREKTVKEKSMGNTEETYQAIRAMLALLDDPFTVFLEPPRYAALAGATMDANITGVGIDMAYASGKVRGTSDQIVVVTATSGGPVEEAGVRPKDAITAVDGNPTKGKNLYEVAEEIQGPAGSTVQLTLTRDGSKDSDTVTVTRRSYQVVPVNFQFCGPSAADGKRLGYVRLSSFNQISGAKTKEAVKSLMADGAEEIVLDLRDNPGGLFLGAVDIAKAFMNEGAIVNLADSKGVSDVFELDGTAFAPNIPLTVLVNSGTASASEVLTGALQDNNRATVVGETTFGKGLIQTLVPLSDGSAVSVTVARYQTPSGADINKVGIQPDKPLPVDDVPADAKGFCSVASSNADLKLFP